MSVANSRLRLLALRLEYDGTAYAGWQRQDGLPSVQGCLEEAIRKITGKASACIAAGRTDAGTHAEGQVVHFRTPSKLPVETWVPALNAHLPPDIAVAEAWEPAHKGFHARYSARGKTYVYTIWNSRGRSALLGNRSWQVPVPLDLTAMRRAARRLVGRHDFRAFAQVHGVKDRKSTVRTLKSLTVKAEGPKILITAVGDGFLTHMVRILAGTLVEVGKGKRTAASVGVALKSRCRPEAGITAPARGLCLMKVDYASAAGRKARPAK